ncbi:MAG TPA: SEC-C domain-containing protein [Steroidobacteraceae bacterium]|nr:SEC-C domain-containing protein [Steroidobacteraceae bacterium]
MLDENNFDDLPIHIEPMIDAAIDAMLKNQEWSLFHAWLLDSLPKFATPTGKTLLNHSGAARAALAFSLGRRLWSALPLPRLGYLPDIIPEPGRNDPCGCGSGKIYKHCCLPAGEPLKIEQSDVWPSLFVKLSPTQRAEALASKLVPFTAFVDYAYAQLDNDNPQQALDALLAIEDAVLSHGDELAATAMSALVRAYGELDRLEDAEVMLRAVIANSPPLRGKAYAHLAALLMDTADSAAAWQTYKDAENHGLDVDSLTDLKIVLLAGDDQREEARALANREIERTLAAGIAPNDARMQFLGGMAMSDDAFDDLDIDEGDGDLAAFADMDYTDEDDEVEDQHLLRLHDWIGDARERPLPKQGYEIDVDTQQLIAPARMRAVEQNWWQVFYAPADAPNQAWDEEQCAAWLDFLDEFPESFDSIAMLAAIAGAIAAHPMANREEVNDDAVALWRRIADLTKQAADNAPRGRLQLSAPLNVAALQSIALLCKEERVFGDADVAIEYAELALRLNPSDEYALRTWLVNEYLQRGDNQHALALTNRFNDDRHEQISFGRALALVRVNQNMEAREAVRRAHERFPQVASYLSAAQMREPQSGPNGDVDLQTSCAWNYRQEMRRAWLATPGAMELLKEVVKQFSFNARRTS